MMGAFQTAAIGLHARGAAVIPTGGDDGKTPLVGGWSRWRGQSRETVEAFLRKHPEANIGLVTGLSRLTVIDADDEKTLADAEARFGRSPLVTRSPRGGGHLYFKSSGERNANLRKAGMNADVRGVGGMVLAPPSVRAGVGSYRIERGGWEDLARLPALAPGALPERVKVSQAQKSRGLASQEGSRNTSLFSALLYRADGCHSLSELVCEALQMNGQLTPPMPRAEAEKTAGSVWRYKQEGRIILPGQQRILMLPAELERMGADAFYLSAWVKRWHGAKAEGELFALSPKAMDRDKTLPGWGRRRYVAAIRALVGCGQIIRVHIGGRNKGDPALYRMGASNAPYPGA